MKNFPSNLIVEVWKDEATLLSVAKAHMSALLAYGWYLEQRGSWQDFYNNEPFQVMQFDQRQGKEWTKQLESYVSGGEVAAWGERLDNANYDGSRLVNKS
ncbi:MAG TPA: family 20 glycosylhydrolase [Candidatus Obscuribacterales bacterium]